MQQFVQQTVTSRPNPSGTCELLCSVDQDVDPGSLGSSALRLLNESDLESKGRMETIRSICIYINIYIYLCIDTYFYTVRAFLIENYCDCFA